MPGILIEIDDACLYVTEKCNSNCIMCPMSLDSRKRGEQMSTDEWENFERVIPSGTNHITITGGEPFLHYDKLLSVFSKINVCYPDTDILVLTNGRVLSIPEIMSKFKPLITEKYCFAIPIHGNEEKLHDSITQSPGSFRQSIIAIHNLAETRAKIEVRVVGHKLNQHQISNTFRMLCNQNTRIDIINLIAMEMTGCAARNRDLLWVDYVKLCEEAEDGIRFATMHGIDIGLYNFPLCQVPERLWPLIKHSISASKVVYSPECDKCVTRDACGGMFYSTNLLGLCSVKPIVEGV